MRVHLYVACPTPGHVRPLTCLLQQDALGEVVAAVAGRCEVYLDGGIRLGTDVLKALALGARAVFIGRPAIYGVAYNVTTSQPMDQRADSIKSTPFCTLVAPSHGWNQFVLHNYNIPSNYACLSYGYQVYMIY